MIHTPRILIACIGNIFLGDDAFGVEVARQLAARPLTEGVRVVDFGIRGFDLAYALMDAPDLAILVDATPRGGQPGTLYVIEPDVYEQAHAAPDLLVETHGMNPVKVLQLVLAMGGEVPPVRVVGCEPATFGSEEDPALALSAPVQAAVPEAIRLIESLIDGALCDHARRANSGQTTTGNSNGGKISCCAE